jgi:hypothetical protein
LISVPIITIRIGLFILFIHSYIAAFHLDGGGFNANNVDTEFPW